MDALRRLVRVLRLSNRAAERELGISTAQLFVLERLAAEPSLSLSELAARTSTDPSSVSVVVSRLVERGLIERQPDPHDARRARLRPSARGRRLVERAPKAPQAALIAAVEALPPADARELERLLEAVVAHMGLDGAEAPLFFEEGDEKGAPRG